MIAPLFAPRLERGAGSLPMEQMVYVIEANQEILAGLSHIICCGAEPPVNFFAYPGKTSTPEPPDCLVSELCDPDMDVLWCLEELADRLGARDAEITPVQPDLPDMPTGPLTAASAGAVIARLMPEETILVNESVTSGAPIYAATAAAARHDWLPTMGGAIGQCLPAATGAAVACPDRKVLALSGDGSAMYTLQSLWTMAREDLDVTVVIFANRGYQILRAELANLGVEHVGRNASAMFDVDNPTLDWVALAKGHGVDGARATTPEAFAAALRDGLDRPGPYLIEVVLAG